MSALPETALPELVELTQLGPNDLDPLLAAEIDVWKRRFNWDFRPSADLLRRFLQLRALYGYACACRASLLATHTTSARRARV